MIAFSKWPLIPNVVIVIQVLRVVSTSVLDYDVDSADENLTRREKREGLVFFQDSRCPKGKFYCQSGECIEGTRLCDGHVHCRSRDDEHENLCKNNRCLKDEFRCDYGGCLRKNQLCNGYPNCHNGADETDELCRTNKCEPNLFQCGNGVCLKRHQLCDGHSHCRDGADERLELCANRECSKEKFKCSDGVCLSTQQLCDGYTNCKDGADEDTQLCLNRSCPRHTFRCDYGACLGKKQLCDGLRNCHDGSDETDDLCRNNECSEGFFRCDYGACLSHDLLCDGHANCHNGADEAPERCRKDNNRISQNLAIGCALPPVTNDKKYTVTCRDGQICGKKAGEKVAELTMLALHCNHGYGYDHMPSKTYCINGTWVPSIGKCKKICKKLEPQNVEISCYRTRTGLQVPCNGNLVEGMLVRLHCLPHYHVETPVTYNEITCKSGGTWSDPLYKCVPDCGKPYSHGTKLISNGTEEQIGESPWNVAVYDVSQAKSPNQICGGTIISTHLIVSAAHCFFDENNQKLFGAKKFEIAVGKVKRNYSVKDNSQTAFYKIREIILSDKGYNGPLTNYAADIAILRTEVKIRINAVVLPACVYLDDRTSFNPGRRKLGKLVGWGYDSKNNPSDVLLTADLPFISRNECLKMVSADFQSSVTVDKFCAGSTITTGAGARPGDSGGGLMYRDSQSGLYYLRGIVSIKDPSTTTSIAAFTDLTFYADWIGRIQTRVEGTTS